jgi:hypothetical protein
MKILLLFVLLTVIYIRSSRWFTRYKQASVYTGRVNHVHEDGMVTCSIFNYKGTELIYDIPHQTLLNFGIDGNKSFSNFKMWYPLFGRESIFKLLKPKKISRKEERELNKRLDEIFGDTKVWEDDGV